MNNLNSVLLEGNLVRDPDLSYTKAGSAICNFSIAVNRFYKKEADNINKVSYFDIVTWAKLAENCNDYLKKGRGVRVVGRLQQDRWEDEEGNTRSKIKVVAEHVEFKPVYKKTA